MKGYPVQVNKTTTMVVGGQDAESGRALEGDVSYPTSAVLRVPASGQTVYLGGPAVDTTGFPLAAGETLEIDMVGDILYGVTATTSQTVYVLRRGQ